MKSWEGQITIFLTLTALSLFALFSTCLEGSRLAALDYLCAQATDSSLRSVFANYQGDVIRDYGLLMCQGSRNGQLSWTDDFLSFAEKYLQPGAGTLLDAGDRIRLRALEALPEKSIFITEGDGSVFSEAVLKYMKTTGLSLLMQELLSRLGLYDKESGIDLLGTLREMVDSQDSSLEGILGRYKNIKEQAAALQEQARKEAEEADIVYPEPVASSEDIKTDLLEQIQAIQKNGLIAILTGTESLSEYDWDRQHLPSALPETEKSKNADYAAAGDSLWELMLQAEYMLGHMSCFTRDLQTGSRYEAEYVLSGRKSDKKALEMVLGEILLIRMGFNLAYLTADAEKMLLAELTAAGIMTLLALPGLILLLKWVLVAAWALAESIVDVRNLLKGKKIPLWKTAGSWSLKAMKLDLSAEASGGKGLVYEDYLRLLFYLGNIHPLSYRMMDVIQERIRLKCPDFLMRDYMVYAAVSLKATASYYYIRADLIRDFFPSDTARQFIKQSRYGYGRR